jgi:hypothetical protein
VEVVLVLLVVAGTRWRWLLFWAWAAGVPLCAQPAVTTATARTRRKSGVRLVDTGPSVARAFRAMTSPFSLRRTPRSVTMAQAEGEVGGRGRAGPRRGPSTSGARPGTRPAGGRVLAPGRRPASPGRLVFHRCAGRTDRPALHSRRGPRHLALRVRGPAGGVGNGRTGRVSRVGGVPRPLLPSPFGVDPPTSEEGSGRLSGRSGDGIEASRRRKANHCHPPRLYAPGGTSQRPTGASPGR